MSLNLISMPNNSGNPNATGSSFYSGGSPMWDPKFKLPSGSNYGSNGNNNEVTNVNELSTLITSVDNLVCSDVVINVTTKTFTVTRSNKSVSFEFSKFVSLQSLSNVLVWNSVDRTPISLIFTTTVDAESVEDRLYTAMNTNVDPGC